MKRIRIDNIEFRKSPSNNIFEIIKWNKNEYYYHKNDYELIPNTFFYRKKNCEYDWEKTAKIHESLFELSEMCITLAYFSDIYNDNPNLITVGDRPFILDDDEFKTFNEIVKYAYTEFRRENGE